MGKPHNVRQAAATKRKDSVPRGLRARAEMQLAAMPTYTARDLRNCKEHLKLADPNSWSIVAEQIQDLGFGLLKAQSKAGWQEPREGIKPLEDLARAADGISKTFMRVKKLQDSNGLVRQVLPNRVDRSVGRNTIDWDAADDAVELIAGLGVQAGAAAAHLRKQLGTSPRQNNPGFAWAIEMFRVYRAHDKRGRLGSRGAGGPFWRFLSAAAAPLGLQLSWPSVHDRISMDVLHKDGASPKKTGSSVPA